MTKSLIVYLLFSALITSSFAQARTITQENFYLYGQKFTVLKPTGLQSDTQMPLVVLFHGCKINAADMVQLSEIEKQLQKKNFIALVPDQSRLLNLDGCWNWFLPANQQNLFWSELTAQKEALHWMLNHYPIRNDRVYLTGFSSGASIALNLFYCYPQSFAGVAIHSGVAFKAAGDLTEANSVLTQGSPKNNAQLARAAYDCEKPTTTELQHKHMIAIHGSDDQRVVIKNAIQSAQQFVGFWDFNDDGRLNNSIAVTVSSFSRSPNDFPTQITRQHIGNKATLDFVQIANLAHRWSGGSAHSPYGEPKSFNATEYILNTFLNSPRKK